MKKLIDNNERINKILNNEDFIKYVNELKILEEERKFCRHGIDHSLDVARIMYIKSLEENLNINKDIIYGAALLHDLGRVLQYKENIEHHKGSSIIAKDILIHCGYKEKEIEEILIAIENHRNNNKETNLSKLLYSCDKLSRLCFQCSSIDECNWKKEKKNMIITY
ncbi:MAG: HD domain-containing protein [Clostridium argentinense]|uniref:HD domain-containing protein n=1 Tax=Clostridium faecium TaxID=2762223 RepID=A0ABR8YMN7_9CLOT|nr:MULTISPECIES: HD domain-containing protein [Clostridium]MBD8045510.1 HD domain-containing protein [Clostridium faecium]MBS5824399.1 HD domain-containing protein [Clostridium argentinense]MDU1348718.1 HD domain-containing protein [Clostridium argentinense]